MASSASAESSLLSKLELLLSSDGRNSDEDADIYSLFSDHLRPFSDLFTAAPNPRKTSKSANQQQQALTRSLAKQYLPFLNRSLSILPKVLSGPRNDQSRLFQTYRLCLRCLDSLASQLSCKPYSIHLQRLRLMRCLESCALYDQSRDEGFAVLESLSNIDLGEKRKGKPTGRFLPDPKGAKEDEEFVLLVAEIVVVLVKCLAMIQSKDGGDYVRITQLVEEAMPWFRVLDANTYEKLHRVLVTYLGKSALFLVTEKKCFDADLVRSFSVVCLAQYVDSPLRLQTFKFARRLCSLLLSEQDERSSLIFDIMPHLSECFSPDAKVVMEGSEIELVELVSYCANKCRNASHEFRNMFAASIETMTCKRVMTPINLILGIYGVGLHLSYTKVKPCGSTASKIQEDSADALQILLANANKLNSLSSFLGPLERYFQIECEDNFPCQTDPCQSADRDTYLFVKHKKNEAYLLLYVNVLKFLCLPLAELINVERKHILAGNEVGSAISLLRAIQDAFNQFCGVLLFYCSNKYEKEKDGVEEDCKMLLGVAIAAFTLSLITKHNLQNTMNVIEQTIASQWIEPHGLKYLLSSLYNIGVLLYRNKQMKEASKALKLSCQASWTCILLYCRRSNGDYHGTNDLSDDAIIDFVNEACARSSFYLDILHQRGSKKVETVILSTIRSWSVAQSKFSRLPGPMPLVKQWTKIQCREQKSSHAENSFSTLCELILSSGEVSNGTLAVISEQELLAYKEMSYLCPDFCKRIRMRIADVLLEEPHLLDNVLQKARLLIQRGISMGTSGVESLNECIKCLSAAALGKTAGGYVSRALLESHQLATAYCLRALCIQEGDPSSKGILQDISTAVKLWLEIFCSDNCSSDEMREVLSEVSLSLLSNILDLLALKGCFAFHLEVEVWNIVMEVFKLKNFPLEKCLSYLWECRRMSHALCTSPISNSFMKIVSKHFGGHSAYMDHWISYLKDSQPLIVGFRNSFSFAFVANSQGSISPEISLQLDSGVHEVKEAVLRLVSSDPVHARGTFTAGHLLFDLCERLMLSGHLQEAFLFAKESHRLRTKLFQEKFTYSIEQQAEKYDEIGEVNQKYKSSITDLHLSRSVAAEVWALVSTFDLEDCYISPWNVLQGYLESTLQVGTIHELIGNGVQAETFFRWGKDISQSQHLSHFTIAFSSALGKLYRQKRLWNLANNELQRAKQILMGWSNDCNMNFTCSKCFRLLEANMDLHVGDLIRSQADRTTRIISSDKLSEAEKLFRSALDKLNHFDKKDADATALGRSAKTYKMGKAGDFDLMTNAAVNQLAARKMLPARGQDVKMEDMKGRKARNVVRASVKERSVISNENKRVTRSRNRSSNLSIGSSVAGEACAMNSSRTDQTDLLPQLDHSENGLSCNHSNMKCLRCHLIHVTKSGLLSNYIDMRWELRRRQTSTLLLIGIGKCIETLDGVHRTHKVFLESISSLVCVTNHLSDVVDLIGKEFSGEILAIERAAVLCCISRFLLKSYPRQRERKKCCNIAQIQLSQVVSWLKLAFVLCRDVPVLVQKVARLLAVTFIYSASCEPISSSCNALSENYWASYFHQASIGSHLNHQFSLHIIQKERIQDRVNVVGHNVADSISINKDVFNLPRLAPEYVKDLEDHVRRFFKSLPCTTVICVSVLSGADTSLLQELFPSSARAWMLLSRLNLDEGPIILLQPLDPILEDAVDDGSSGSDKLSDSSCLRKQWHCPWGFTVIDDIIPTYKDILKENYLSSSVYPLEDTKENRLSWWKRRKTLDLRLSNLLRKLEVSWLVPWRHLLVGGLINSDHLDSVHKKLMSNLKSKCKVDADEAFVRLILSGAKSDFHTKAFTAELLLGRGCYVGSITHYDEDGVEMTSTSHRADKLSCLACELVCQAVSELEVEDDAHREPIILVLDSEVQMLPWENLPTLRSHEVYRMPSVDSITVTLDRSRYYQEYLGKVAAAFPVIDPLDAFFLLNPGGDLSSTQMEFEKWFRDHKLEGKAGSAPATEELARALQRHDLYIYFGHGSGAQYIPRHEIQKLETCAATLLMGCSSGALSLHGPYMPEGTPLSYLAAGSPAIVANLWEVTDKDIDRFGKAMLDAFLEERSKANRVCTQCNSLAKEFEEMKLKNNKNKKKLSKNKLALESRDSGGCCGHSNARVGSFMSRAREACMLPFLIGAAPVCYGVPTCITRKKDL